MRAIIVDNKWVYFDNVTVSEEEILWNEFSVSRPNAYIDPNQMSQWDGVFRKYNRAKKRVAFPFLGKVKKLAAKHGFPLDIDDQRNLERKLFKIGHDHLPGIKLEQYQIEATEAALNAECGVINVPTGGGKGELVCAIVKALDCATVILADQTIVVDQLKARLELREVSDTVGMFYAGKRPNGETVVVGSIQSLTKVSKPPQPPSKAHCEDEDEYNRKVKQWERSYKGFKTRQKTAKSLLQYVENADCLIVDEADRAVSDPWKVLFRSHFKGSRRYGFSGTPTDPAKPVEAMVLEEHLGPIIYTAERKKLTELGRIIPCKYYSMCFGLDGSIKNSTTYDQAYNEFMVENNAFHNDILKLTTAILKRNSTDGVLILVEREALGNNLLALFKANEIDTEFIFGKTNHKQRKIALSRFEQREIRVIIGGKILNRGLDLKGGTEHLILATGGKLATDFIQKVGRAVRLNSVGSSKIYDFYFRCNKYLYQHSKARLKAIVDMGYESIVAFPGGTIDGSELIRRRFSFKFKSK
jgi:superfamily II DNA or RNA helicase